MVGTFSRTQFITMLHFFLAILKNSSYDGALSVCIFVALSVRMCVEGANKIEGTMSNYK